jgi:protein-tyrosine phosphatase
MSEPIGDHDAQLPDGASEAERQAFGLDTYGRMVFDAAPQFAALFKRLCTGSLPTLYHCAAGRDRTGVFTAILLLSLGVPFETVIADYDLSERFMLGPYWRLGAPPADPDPDATVAARIAKKNADLDAVLQKALDDINARFGSFNEYRRRMLEISDSDLRAFKRRILAKR